MTPEVTFTQRGGDGAGFFYLLASGGASGSINFDFTTGVLPGAITFTRASIGTYTNNAGTLITAGNDVARFNYIAGVANLLIEGSATNLQTQSNNFSAWNAVNSAVVTAAQFTSPDGTNNGWSITSGAGNGHIARDLAWSNVPNTVSVWAKQIVGTAPLRLGIDWTLLSSSISTSTTLTRFSFTATPPAETGSTLIQVLAATGSTNGIFGAQVETGTVPTSYIPTTTAAVTRAADSAVFTVPSGIGHLTYTFDDNTTQSVTVSPGSYTIPVTLNRPNIKSIVGSA